MKTWVLNSEWLLRLRFNCLQPQHEIASRVFLNRGFNLHHIFNSNLNLHSIRHQPCPPPYPNENQRLRRRFGHYEQQCEPFRLLFLSEDVQRLCQKTGPEIEASQWQFGSCNYWVPDTARLFSPSGSCSANQFVITRICNSVCLKNPFSVIFLKLFCIGYIIITLPSTIYKTNHPAY